MKDSNLSRAAGMVQQLDIHVLDLGHALSMLVFLFFSIQLTFCDCLLL